MTTSNPLRKSVEDALSWTPDLDERRIGVAAEDGVVTLTGHVPSYAEKMIAERTAKRVHGVRALANDLDIDLPGDSHRTDTEIAEAAANSLKWATLVPHERIKVTLHNGWVSLEGEVEWKYQREAAYNTVRHLMGIKGIDNLIAVKSSVKPEKVKERIKEALVRDARLEAGKIQVEAEGRTVVLRGEVDSWSDREHVEDAAWAVPGVWDVEDHLTVTS